MNDLEKLEKNFGFDVLIVKVISAQKELLNFFYSVN